MKTTGRMKRSLAFLLCLAMLVTTLLSGLTVYAAEGTPDDFAAMRQKFYDMAVGGSYDPDDARVQPMLHSINSTAQHYWDKMNKNPVSNAVNGSYRDANDQLMENLDSSQDYIFEEYPLGRRRPSSTVYMNANSIHFTFQYIRAMALAYETKGCDLYHNQEMLSDIKNAVKFVYDNHFHPGMDRYGNWFSWQIGAPIYLGETLLLLYDEFTAQEIQDYANAMISFLGTTTMTGANATWTERVRMYTGILLEDSKWLDFVQSKMPGMLTYTTKGDGYYTDGTFVQHDKITYNGGYGLMCLTDSAYILYMLSDSPWALSDDSANIIYQWVYDTYEPFVYNGLAMDVFRGREITRYDTTQPRGGLVITNAMLMLAQSAPADVAGQFKGVIKQWYSNDFMIDELNNSADTPWFKFPLDTVVKVNEILDDASIAPISLAGNNYQMSAGARTIHWADDWTYAISMTSRRIANCEIGDSNAKGWYTGFGMTYLYNNDLERYEGVQKATIDWLRLPGTTSYRKAINSGQLNEKSFVGGATDGTYGVTGMDLAMGKYKIAMKKSWFMFDDEVVALGSGISGNDVMETTFENYMLEEGNRTYAVDGQQKTMAMDGQTLTYPGATTFHMQGNVPNSDIGFYFPEGTDLNITSEHRSGKWTDLGEYNTDPTVVSADYFTAWQSHGANPTDAGYSYVMLPGKSDAETASYASSSDIEILQRDEKAHAVYEKTLGTLGVNFWQNDGGILDVNGVKNYVSSDSAASIMVSENDNVMDVSISDATQENKGAITVEINRAAKGVLEMDEGVELVQSSPSIKLKVNVKNSAGKSFHVKLSYDEVALQPTEILSTEMVDDALVVTLKAVPNAESYDVKFGTESGVYTSTLGTKDTTLSIYGLTPGETYYLAALAKNADGESALSEEVSITLPATTAFFDEFENYDKMLSYTSGWLFDAGDPGKYAGDATRLKRAAQTKESFSYLLPGLQGFQLEVYGYRKSIGVIKLYTSADGETWTEQAYKTLGIVPSDGEWYREVLSPDGAVNAGANYFKVELQSHPEKVWAPQFTKFNATMKNSSDQKTVKDPLLNDSKIYETSGVTFETNDDPSLYGGDTDVVKATAGGSMLYSYTNLQGGKIVTYESGTPALRIQRGESKDMLEAVAPQVTEEDVGGGVKKVTYDFSGLPGGTDYLCFLFDENMVVSDVSFTYKPDNSPISHIRFADSALDGVISYDATPLIKKAPANGISEILYSTSDPNVAKYMDGTLQFVGTGTAVAKAQIADTGSTAELPLEVYKNLCLKKPVDVSSVNTVYAKEKAVDGDMIVSRWQSNTDGQEWIQVDMGPGATFDAVDIQWYSNGADYNIQTSDDGSNWTTIKEVTGQKSGGYVRFDFDTPQTARYLKVQGVTENQYSLFELRALSKTSNGSSQEVTNLAIGKKATVSASDPNDSSLTPAKAIDGDEGTRWASGRDNNQWFTVDLGGVCQVEAINILWEGAAGKEYKVQISDDNQNWTDMVHETANKGAGWKRYSLSEIYTGRYVRMLGISRVNTKYGYSMYEFEIMGVALSESEPMPITEISLNYAELGLLKGQSAQLNASTKPLSNAASVAWKTSDVSVATVSDKGEVTALGDSGTATITAYSVLDESVKAECVVTITPYAGLPTKVQSVKIDNAPAGVLYLGETYDLTATVLPENATNKNVNWESDDPSVAVVNAAGRVTILGVGKANITAKSVSSGLSDTIEIRTEERTYGMTVNQTRPDAMAEASIVTDPAGPVKAGTAVTVKVSGIEEGYVLQSLTASYGENQTVVVAEITENVSEGERHFLFSSPKGDVKISALFTADKSGLTALMDEAGAKVESAYTADSWKTLADAMAAARDVISDDAASKDDVTTAETDLQTALDGLILKEDQEAYDALMEDAQKALTDNAGNLYEEETPADERPDGSFGKTEYEALAAAKDAAAAEAPSKDVIAALKDALEAFNATKVTVDAAKLTAILESAAQLSEYDYTPDTWSALATAVTAAEKLLEDGGYTEKAVEAAWTAINGAKAALHRQFAITVDESMAHGSIEADAYIPQGENAVLTVKADEGYRLKTLTVDGVDVTGAVVDGKFTVQNVQSEVKVEAVFEKYLSAVVDGRLLEMIGDNLPDGATLKGENLPVSDVKLKGYAIQLLTDIALSDADGAALQPTGLVTLRMVLPEALYEAAMNGDLEAILIDGDNQAKLENVQYLLEGETWVIQAETDKVGKLALALKAADKPDDKPFIPGGNGSGSDWHWPDGDASGDTTTNGSGNSGKENPGSGDGSQMPIALALLAASAGVAVLLSRKKKF
ncbi:polysaccharide lyase family 8 super-sandwich domain-containing protein [Zongyangia hominis]|uniref:Discoidin domain-containing protein n=1 Tax=Zongyangia hominis TaxID=2763677 RepID=A0A926I712_9FIRM|nr:polysaccharide lyase family 8 super-sandwich domain-containing protein [Zongyangia hominis]MBC8570614.1 discoidin domain-containing protein [Zongyangia hominis]